MAAGSIVVDLLMKTGSFETDTKRAEKRLRELKKEAESIGKAIGVAFVAVGAASVALVKNAIDAADATSKLAQQTGTTVEELSALTYAADLAGVSQEELGSGLVKLAKNMSDAVQGIGEARKGFDSLGISVKNADGSLKGSDKVLAEIADKFAGAADGAEKTSIAVNIFGKSGARLIPLLNAGASGLADMKEEASKLGIVLDTDVARSSEQFNDNLTRISSAIRGIAHRALPDLLPALNDVSQAFVDMAKSEAVVSTVSEVVKSVIGGLVNVFQTLAIVGANVGFVFLSTGREIGAWAAQLAALARLDIDGFKAISAAVKEDAARARAELDAFEKRILSIGQPLSPALQEFSNEGRSRPKTSLRGIAADPKATKAAPKERRDKFTAENQALSDALRSLEQTDIAKIAALEARLGELFNLQRETRGDPVVVQAIKATREEIEKIKALDIGTAILDPLEATKNLFLRSEKDYEGAAKALEDLIEQQERARTLGKDVGYTIAFAFEDAIVSGNKLSDVLKRLGQDLLRLLVNRYITQQLATSIGAAFGGARAEGGPVAQGSSYMVGERGPELFVPNTAGTIVPNGAGAGGAIDVQVINNGQPVNAKATTQRQDTRTLIKVVLDAVGADLSSGSGPASNGLRARGFNLGNALPRRA